MSVSAPSEFVQKGEIVVERGGIVAVHNGKSMPSVVSWLKTHLMARLDKNAQVPVKGNHFIFFGSVQSTLVELISADADVAYTSLALRSRSQEGFYQSEAWLTLQQGFTTVEDNRADKWTRYLFSSELGLAIRLVWREVIPIDPAVTEGTGQEQGQMQLEFDKSRQPDEESDRQPETTILPRTS